MNKLKVGIHAPFLNDDLYDDNQIKMIELIDELGYSVVWVRDVPLHSPIYQQTPDQMYEPFVYLSYIAAKTKQIKLGTSAIVLGERQAVLAAKMAASLDRLSNGRLILGVGSGDRPDEFAAFGVNYEERYARTVEGIDVIRELWKNKPVYTDGKFTHINGQTLSPPPVQEAGPPIWIVGNAGQTPEWIAQNTDGWFYHSSDHSKATISTIRKNSPEGKHVSAAFSTYISLSESKTAPLQHGYGLSGGTDAILAELLKYKSWGLDYFSVKKFVGHRSEKEQVIQFAEEILPYL
jgi:luciferase-type oxidoreductase